MSALTERAPRAPHVIFLSRVSSFYPHTNPQFLCFTLRQTLSFSILPNIIVQGPMALTTPTVWPILSLSEYTWPHTLRGATPPPMDRRTGCTKNRETSAYRKFPTRNPSAYEPYYSHHPN
jgi:hypothetical protein